MSKYKKVTILVPVYNEERTIREVLDKIKRAPLPHGLEREIVVIDDGSCDGSREKLSGISGIRILSHERNQGKGAAIKTGLRHATGDVILIQDADLEYSPEDYPMILQPLLSGFVEFVMGSRFFCETPRFFSKDGAPFFSHFIGNWMIIRLTNLLYGQNMTDYEGGYKAFTASLARSIPIEADGFAFDNELICKCVKRGYKIAEVPIRYKPRLYTEGKKISWRDGLVILWTIIKWRFHSS
jgi:glycosyltransferase involved in cell wall biosynthesis